VAELEPGSILTGASGAQYVIGGVIGEEPVPGQPCDAHLFGGAASASVLTGGCRCVVCPRCHHHTGNAHQGHYWAWCRVTGAAREFHFCCPDLECEPEETDHA